MRYELNIAEAIECINTLKELKVELAAKDQYHLYSEGVFETLAVYQKGTEEAERLVASFDEVKNFGSPHSCSAYLYTPEYLYRCSDHFGSRIAGCSWYLDKESFPLQYAREEHEGGKLSMQGADTPVVVLARIRWEDLRYKAEKDRDPIFVWWYLTEEEQGRLLDSGLVEWVDQEKGWVKFNCGWTTFAEALGRDPLEGLNCY